MLVACLFWVVSADIPYPALVNGIMRMRSPYFSDAPLVVPPRLERELFRCRCLPSSVAVVLRLLELAQHPEMDMAELRDLVASDIGLSARLLQMANQPLYASHQQINTLSQALTLLGTHASVHIALGFSLSTALDEHETEPAALQQLWLHSHLASQAACLLGLAGRDYRSEELALAGLLQSIGRLALLAHPSLKEALEDEQTYHHAAIGVQLAQQWSLPPYLVDAIAGSDKPLNSSASRFDYCVNLSAQIADLCLASEKTPAYEQHYSDCLQRASQYLGLTELNFAQTVESLAQLVPTLRAHYVLDKAVSATDLRQRAAEIKELRQLYHLHELRLQSPVSSLQSPVSSTRLTTWPLE